MKELNGHAFPYVVLGIWVIALIIVSWLRFELTRRNHGAR